MRCNKVAFHAIVQFGILKKIIGLDLYDFL